MTSLVLDSSLGKSTPIGCSVPNGQLENIHTSSIIETKQVVFTYLGIDMYICIHLYMQQYSIEKSHNFQRKREREKIVE